MIDPSSHYWPRYCEENVWHLCGDLLETGARAWAVFVSSPTGRVAVWCQRAAGDGTQPIAWDYHVVALVAGSAGLRVLDADSTLATPAPLDRYLDRSFRALPPRLAGFRPRFRIVEAAEYRRLLLSDRRHMQSPNGDWLAPPPPWPPIGEGSNLMRFVDMGSTWAGEVYDLPGLRRWARSEA